MDKKEIQYVMAIARPAIWALYGRQKLKLLAYEVIEVTYYSDLLHQENEGKIYDISGRFEVLGIAESYKIEIKGDIVTSLALGESNV